jgi:hypothetical protein
MKNFNKVILIVLFLISCLSLSGINLSATDPQVFVYLHTDRRYYLPGETVYFKAYILEDPKNRTNLTNDSLCVSLLDQDGLEVASGILPIDNSQISGNIELPDILTEGNYILLASTRLTSNQSPAKMFSRIIEIREAADPDLITDLSLRDTVYDPGSLLTAQLKFYGKENKAVPAGFAYRLSGTKGDILSGKSKADNEGQATLRLQLPQFDNSENLKLIIDPSYKGSRTMTGVVIPTRSNYIPGHKIKNKNTIASGAGHLNIAFKTTRVQSGKDENVRLDISVTDDKGIPTMASLSVSASNIFQNQFIDENDNIAGYLNRMNSPSAVESGQNTNKYFTHYLIQETQAPGIPFIVQEKNNPKKLKKIEQSRKEYGYSGDHSIFDILKQIKPYHIENGKIIFGISAFNSINSVEGALIVVDGVKMGTNSDILNTIPVSDIARITASTNVMDMQRYSALNSTGVIEISMKKNSDFIKKEGSASDTKNSTLFWGPDIKTDAGGKASVSFLNNKLSAEILIAAEGIAANGLSGSSSLNYNAK